MLYSKVMAIFAIRPGRVYATAPRFLHNSASLQVYLLINKIAILSVYLITVIYHIKGLACRYNILLPWKFYIPQTLLAKTA